MIPDTDSDPLSKCGSGIMVFNFYTNLKFFPHFLKRKACSLLYYKKMINVDMHQRFITEAWNQSHGSAFDWHPGSGSALRFWAGSGSAWDGCGFGPLTLWQISRGVIAKLNNGQRFHHRGVCNIFLNGSRKKFWEMGWCQLIHLGKKIRKWKTNGVKKNQEAENIITHGKKVTNEIRE
jgi:hypothetical protein